MGILHLLLFLMVKLYGFDGEIMKVSEATKEKLWRHKVVQAAIDSGHPAHVRYISPLPRGDGKIHSCKGIVVSQDALYMFVKRPHSSKVRILKSQIFLITTQEKRRPRKRKGVIKFQKE